MAKDYFRQQNCLGEKFGSEKDLVWQKLKFEKRFDFKKIWFGKRFYMAKDLTRQKNMKNLVRKKVWFEKRFGLAKDLAWQDARVRGGGPRAGPPVVRGPGHHEVVERPLAQRGLRLLCGVHRHRFRSSRDGYQVVNN